VKLDDREGKWLVPALLQTAVVNQCAEVTKNLLITAFDAVGLVAIHEADQMLGTNPCVKKLDHFRHQIRPGVADKLLEEAVRSNMLYEAGSEGLSCVVRSCVQGRVSCEGLDDDDEV
jgi:hypothetical protein